MVDALEIGYAIKDRRAELGMTQAQLAEAVEALPLVAGAGTKPRRAAGQAHRRARGPGARAGADCREPLRRTAG